MVKAAYEERGQLKQRLACKSKHGTLTEMPITESCGSALWYHWKTKYGEKTIIAKPLDLKWAVLNTKRQPPPLLHYSQM